MNAVDKKGDNLLHIVVRNRFAGMLVKFNPIHHFHHMAPSGQIDLELENWSGPKAFGLLKLLM